jgi:Carboxypeptidase regulatory-like domain
MTQITWNRLARVGRNLKWSFALLCAATLVSGLSAQNPPGASSGRPDEEKEQRDGSVSGRVVMEGTGVPVPGMSVSLAGPQEQPPPVKTDAQGRYQFDKVARNRYIVTIDEASGYESSPVMVDLRAGQKLIGIDLNVHRSAVVAGKVQDSDRRPVAGASVWLLRVDTLQGSASTGRGTRTNQAGEFRITNVPSGRYKVAVEVQTIQIQTGKSSDGDLPEPVEHDVATFYPNSGFFEGAQVLKQPISYSPGRGRSASDRKCRIPLPRRRRRFT